MTDNSINPRSVIDPRRILCAMPSITGQNHSELTGSLVMCANRFGAFFPLLECSHPSLARNMIAEFFMNHPQFEWLLCIDSDIAFGVADLDLLLEPCDLAADYDGPGLQRPTRVTTSLATAGRPLDETTLGAADALVCAQYRYKRDNYDVVNLGMGFVRIHRSVFEHLQKLEHPKNPDCEEYERVLNIVKGMASERGSLSMHDIQVLESCRPNPGGGPRLWQAQRDGRVIWDYFPSGPIISTLLPTADWKGEDHGFFTLCMLSGIVPRIETRTGLVHIGRKGYVYEGPDGGGGQ